MEFLILFATIHMLGKIKLTIIFLWPFYYYYFIRKKGNL